MTIRTILTEPNKILRQISKPVEFVGKEEQQLMDDMLETMYDAKGIGLAAIQIGVPKRIIVIDISKKENEINPMYFVNPLVKNKNINLNYFGEKKIIKAEGLLATCIQHEIDHLEGVLFIDYLSKLKKTMIIKKLSKQKSKVDRIIV